MADYQLYLIRHGIAEERGEAWPDDAKRPLTARARAGCASRRAAWRGSACRSTSCSRARSSAPVRPATSSRRRSTPGRPSSSSSRWRRAERFRAVLAELEKQARRSRIALVGHEPGIGELAAQLAGSRHPLEFKKGAVCRIDVDALSPPGPGTLRWFLTPRIMRALRQ